MKKYLALSLLALGWAGSAQAATTISFAAGTGTIPAGFTVFQNFDSFASGTSIGTNAFAVSTDISNVQARPAFGSTGNYAAVLTGGSYSVSFGPATAFSFALGSLDTYNTLTLRYANGSILTLNGGEIVSDPSFDSGNRTSAETNGVVTYRIGTGDSLITGATFTTTGNSFEFDNLAAVPEPAAWGMMILGFGLVGGAMRRRPTTRVRFA